MKNNPCRDCPDRKPNCHTKECVHGWYEWDIEHKLLRKKIRDDKVRGYRADEGANNWRRRKDRLK